MGGAVALWLGRGKPPAVAMAGPPPAGGELRAVTLVFGQKDSEPTKWDGSVAISAGSIEKVAGYHFTQAGQSERRILAVRYASVARAIRTRCGLRERPQPHAYLTDPLGVTIYYRAPADAEIRVKLAQQGEFAFRPAELPEIESIFPLRALVEVRRSPVVETMSESEYEDDYPSMAVGRQ